MAAFDFDGTLSTRANVLPFLRRVAGTWHRERGHRLVIAGTE